MGLCIYVLTNSNDRRQRHGSGDHNDDDGKQQRHCVLLAPYLTLSLLSSSFSSFFLSLSRALTLSLLTNFSDALPTALFAPARTVAAFPTAVTGDDASLIRAFLGPLVPRGSHARR